ncbi:MAG TPA: DUF4337 domain-containing protein [Abditibacteriaceae bacterium]
MALDPMEMLGEEDDKKGDAKKAKFNSLIAVSIAVLATFMSLCSVKAGNIAQAMQAAQADKIDNYAWYQARKIRADVAQSNADTLRLQALSVPPSSRAAVIRATQKYQTLASEQQEKMKEQEADAKAAEKEYASLNIHDDQFDLSEAMLSLSFALLAVAALTQKKWLFGLALVPITLGILMGLAGLFEWGIHSQVLADMLS